MLRVTHKYLGRVAAGARERQSELTNFSANPSSGTQRCIFSGGWRRRRQSELKESALYISGGGGGRRQSELRHFLAVVVGGANPSSGTFSPALNFDDGRSKHRDFSLIRITIFAKWVAQHTVGATPLLRQTVSQ